MAKPASEEVEKNELISRRLFRDASDRHYIVDEDGLASFTLSAFYENRSGADVSVDIMWKDGSASKKEQSKVLSECVGMARREREDLIGWATCRKDLLLQAAKNAVDSIRRTPKSGVNEYHGDIVKAPFLTISDADTSRDAKRKAELVAKTLADAYNAKGRLLTAESSSAASSGLGALIRQASLSFFRRASELFSRLRKQR